jgi:hypothetical protein
MHIDRVRRPAFTGAPHQNHGSARCLGAGWRSPQVARVLHCEPMHLHLLLREETFAELFRACLDLAHLPVEERVQCLEQLALLLLEEAAHAGDARVAWFVVRARQLGCNPATTLARGIAAAVERDGKAARPYQEEPPPPVVDDDAKFQAVLAGIRAHGPNRRSLPPDPWAGSRPTGTLTPGGRRTCAASTWPCPTDHEAAG